MNFDERLAQGRPLEDRTLAELRRRGWAAEPFGQGQLTDQIRDRLRFLNTPIRWMADIIAIKGERGDTVLAFVDAKGGRTYLRTGNHCIEATPVTAAEGWTAMADCHQYYFVFDDLGVLTPEEVRQWGRPGRTDGGTRGSNTPYLLVPAELCRPFDTVFGEPAPTERNRT